MRTTPLDHQKDYILKYSSWVVEDGNPFFGLICEQGTGKTWMAIKAIETQYEKEEIEAVIIVAPKSVHPNWVRREIPMHMSMPHDAFAYRSGIKAHEKKLATWKFRKSDTSLIRIVSINYGSAVTAKGTALLKDIMQTWKTMLILDESVTIKNPKTATCKKVFELAALAKHRLILTGTPITNAPHDLWSQLEFMQRELSGHKTYHSFMARYCNLLPAHHPLVMNIVAKTRSRGTPAIIRKDEGGKPMFRNLDELAELIKPFTFRVTKEDALDLPPKVYLNRYYEQTRYQKSIYAELARTHGFMMDWGDSFTIADYHAATANIAMAQVNSGILPPKMDDDATREYVDFTPTVNPKMKLLMEIMENEIHDKQVIIWARFHSEIQAIHSKMIENDYSVRTLYGATSTEDRQISIDGFQSGEYQVLIANAQAGGEGITLTAAHNAIYYSNDYNFRSRAQSEDRCHRKGTQRSVNYYDLIADGTIDEKIIEALQRKKIALSSIIDR